MEILLLHVACWAIYFFLFFFFFFFFLYELVGISCLYCYGWDELGRLIIYLGVNETPFFLPSIANLPPQTPLKFLDLGAKGLEVGGFTW
ncbi:hypothetical protein DL95DRAFT_188565 [Leptodontidium sp. 2 PMI_412]|nr:hypothetical protein DL95DRAFT_188565 [Leptodontidium sp. 2 PMI_412]